MLLFAALPPLSGEWQKSVIQYCSECQEPPTTRSHPFPSVRFTKGWRERERLHQHAPSQDFPNSLLTLVLRQRCWKKPTPQPIWTSPLETQWVLMSKCCSDTELCGLHLGSKEVCVVPHAPWFAVGLACKECLADAVT